MQSQNKALTIVFITLTVIGLVLFLEARYIGTLFIEDEPLETLEFGPSPLQSAVTQTPGA